MRLFITFLSVFLSWAPNAFGSDAAEILRKQQKASAGYIDEISTGTLTLLNAHSKPIAVREFEVKRLEATARTGARTLLAILAPADLAGVKLLSVEKTQRDFEQFLYLPSQKQIKRIGKQSRSGSFLGSEFSYSNLEAIRPQSDHGRLLKDEILDGAECFVIETAAPKTVLWIRKDGFQIARVDFYGDSGEVEKRAFFGAYRLIQNKIYRPSSITMLNLKTQKQSRLELKSVRFQTGLTESDFTQAALSR